MLATAATAANPDGMVTIKPGPGGPTLFAGPVTMQVGAAVLCVSTDKPREFRVSWFLFGPVSAWDEQTTLVHGTLVLPLYDTGTLTDGLYTIFGFVEVREMGHVAGARPAGI